MDRAWKLLEPVGAGWPEPGLLEEGYYEDAL